MSETNQQVEPELNQSQQVNIHRRVYLQDSLNKEADYRTPHNTFKKKIKKKIRNYNLATCVRNSFPILDWLPQYKIHDYLIPDLITGLTTGALHIPHGIAYSLLADLSPEVGLHMAFFPIFVYIILGSSPHICLGTFALAMLMTGKIVREHSGPSGTDTPGYTPDQVVSTLTFTVGVILLIMCVLRLGALSSLLSEPLVSAMMTGGALLVCVAQFKDLLGLELTRIKSQCKILYVMISVVKHFDEINWATVTFSAITIVILIVFQMFVEQRLYNRFGLPIHCELIILLISTGIAKFFALEQNFGIKVVGSIPTGLPAPKLPEFKLINNLLVEAIILTLVTYTITMSMGLIFSAKDKYEIDANQELLALGASNIFGCFFGCAPVCATLSRSYLQHQMGGKTLVMAFVSTQFILLTLLFLGPIFHTVPRCVLAAIIVVSLKDLYLLVQDVVKFWKVSKLDTLVWIVTFVVTLMVDVEYGLAAGLLTAIGTLFYIAQQSYSCLLGRVPHTNLYLDIGRYRGVHEIAGVKIFHFCGGLNFASKNVFRDKLYRKTGFLRIIDAADSEKKVTASCYVWNTTISDMTHCIIIDASALSYVDAPGIKIIIDATDAFRATSITPLLAGANAPILEMIDRFNSLEKDRLQLQMFPTVHDAVTYYKTVVEPVVLNLSTPSLESFLD